MAHRLRYLLFGATMGAIDHESSGLLCGPLTRWCTAESIPAFPYDPGMVQTLLSAVQGDTPFQAAVATRISILYAMLSEHKHIPPAARFPYYVGVMIDLHWNALVCPTLYHACRAGVCPEQQSITAILADESLGAYSMRLRDVERVWTGVASGAVFDEFDPWKPPRSDAAQKNVYKKVDPRSAFPSQSHPETPSVGEGGVVSILRYCFKCTQARYIKRNLVRRLTDDTCDRVVLTDIIRRGMLGAYRHARVIASPIDRLAVYRMSPDDVEAALAASSSDDEKTRTTVSYEPRSVFMAIAEFMLGVTAHHPAIERALVLTTSFDEYKRTVQSTMDDHIRRKRRSPIDVVGIPSHPTGTTAHEAFDALYGAFKIDESRPPTQLRHVTSGGVSLRRFAEHVEDQHGSLQICRGVLEAIGLAPRDVAEIRDALTLHSAEPACRAAIRKLPPVLSARGRAKFRHYLWLMARRARTGYIWNGTDADVTGDDIVICTDCNAMVSENIETQRRTKGVELNTVTGAVRCPECASSSFTIVPTQLYTVTSATEDGHTCTITMCQRCTWATEYNPLTHVGQHSYCPRCYVHEANDHVLTTCVCGVTVERNRNYGGKIIVQVRPGVVEQRVVCRTHARFVRMARGHGPMPLAWYARFVPAYRRPTDLVVRCRP